MVESATFQHLAIKYNVSSVPKIIINEGNELLGDQSIEALLEAIEKI